MQNQPQMQNQNEIFANEIKKYPLIEELKSQLTQYQKKMQDMLKFQAQCQKEIENATDTQLMKEGQMDKIGLINQRIVEIQKT